MITVVENDTSPFTENYWIDPAVVSFSNPPMKSKPRLGHSVCRAQ